MKRRFLTTTLLVCSFIICLAAVAADLSGKWLGSYKTGNGDEIPLTYVFKVDGEKLTGSITSPNGELIMYDGKIKDNVFSYKIDIGDNPVLSSGKFYGDSTTIDIDFNGRKTHSKLLRAKE